MYLFMCVCIWRWKWRWSRSARPVGCIKWENDCDCSSRQTGKHIFDCLFDPRVCRRKQQTCWKKMMSTTRSNVDLSLKTLTTTIIHNFTVCWWCSSENLHHHNNYKSTLIIFKQEPSAMQMPLSSSLRFVAKHLLISFSFSSWTKKRTNERMNEWMNRSSSPTVM